MNDRQRRFCEAYAADPNATKAAISAGYNERTAYSQGQRLLKNVEVASYLAELTDKVFSVNIATLAEVRSFWSDVFRDPQQKTVDRLRASELLVKSSGLLIASLDPGGGIEEDTIIYIPRMRSENECTYSEEETE